MRKPWNQTHIRQKITITALPIGFAVLSVLGGCSLSLADIPLAKAANDTREARLAGLYITTDSIDPSSPEIAFDLNGNISFKEQEPTKIYGIINDPKDLSRSPVTFPGLEGFGIYRLQMQDNGSQEPSGYYFVDDLLTDCHFTTSEEEDHSEASLYVNADIPFHYYYNPVYQQEDGTLYLVPGEGLSSTSLTPGVQWSQSIAQSYTRCFHDTEETESYRFTVNIIAEEAPGETELFFLDSGNQVLGSLSGTELEALLEQGDSPTAQNDSQGETMLKVPAGTAYLILCQKAGGKDEPIRTLFDYGSEYLEYKTLEENGCLRCNRLALDWS